MDYETVSKLLRYEPETGRLYWLVDRGGMKAGWEAGYRRNDGYRYTRVMGRQYLSHLLAWLLHTEEWPKSQLDHINHKNDDNRIRNLREVTHQENQRNAKLRKDNSSGLTGVAWRESSQRWHARMTISGKPTHLGSFDNIFDAACCRKSAENRYGFHENHGTNPV